VPQVEKVTAFVTRGTGEAAELLVFRHGRSGVQVPAGTVEADESPNSALLREVGEETGLTEVRLIRTLGQLIDELSDERCLLNTEPLRVAPTPDADLASGTAYRGLTFPVRKKPTATSSWGF
jgi:8-oxo-dGTP pyrophosphatase MutT (NUDIX family)